MTWLKAADKYARLAKAAHETGDLVVLIVALQRAAECLQIARNLEPVDAPIRDRDTCRISDRDTFRIGTHSS